MICETGAVRTMKRGLSATSIVLAIACAPIFSASAKPADTTAREYRFSCRGGEQVLVSESRKEAAVRVGNSTYRLSHRASSFGKKFDSPDATLIIDGSFAAFVAKDRVNLRECYAQRQ